MPYKDPERRKDYNKKFSADPEHRVRAKELRQQKIARNRQFIRDLKNSPCTDCGNTYPYYVMDFDHRDPSEKSWNVSKFTTRSIEALLAEIAKCDLVCSNCHRVRTHQRALEDGVPED